MGAAKCALAALKPPDAAQEIAPQTRSRRLQESYGQIIAEVNFSRCFGMHLATLEIVNSLAPNNSRKLTEYE